MVGRGRGRTGSELWKGRVASRVAEWSCRERERGGWSPVGRNGWRHQPRARLLTRIAEGDLCSDLVTAGLAGGSQDRLAAYVEQYANFVARLRWN